MPGLPCMLVRVAAAAVNIALVQPRSVRPSVRTLLFPIFLRCYPRSLARSDGFGIGNNFTPVVDSSEQAARRTRQRQRLRFSRKVQEEGHSSEQGFFCVTIKVEDFSCQICQMSQKVNGGYFQFPIVLWPELKQKDLILQ